MANKASESYMTQIDEIKQNLSADLLSHVCVVVFDKLDGTERRMVCTLKEDLLPKNSPTIIEGKHSEHKVVFDMEKEEFRSFLWPRVKQYWRLGF